MSNLLRKSILFLLMTLSSCLISCHLFEGSCGDVLPFFQIEQFVAANNQFDINQEFKHKPVSVDEEVRWDKYFIRFIFKGFHYALNQDVNSGGGNLFATTCDTSQGLGQDRGIDTLYLVSIYDYNESYAANDTINEIALTSYYVNSSRAWENFMTLEEYVEENKYRVFNEYFHIKFSEQPSSELSQQQFKMIYHLTSGEVLEAISQKVFLKAD